MRARLIAVLACCSLAAACGGSDDAAPATTGSTAEAPTTSVTPTTPAAEETPTTSAAPSTSAAADSTTTTAAPLESTPIPVIAVEDIPALVIEWGTGAGDPLDLARRLIGFPLEIAPPAGATPYRVDVSLRGEDPTVDWRWEWTYGAYAAPDTVGDIDAELPEGGPGTIEGLLHYDPLFAAFGWSNRGQVISDPSNGGGGPQSVNWAYGDDDGSFRLGEINATPVAARAWVDEDIDFRDGPDTPGHRIDVTLEAQPNFIPVPLLEALFREVPVAPGARITEIDFRSFDRPDDSFDAEEGTRYLELSYTCELLPNSANAAREVYSTGLTGTAYQMGEEDFFNDGFITIVDGEVGADGVWRQPVIVLDRYPGEISVWTNDDGTVMSRVDVTLEPGREVLQQLEE
ncbi:MAG: hypothetical protein AAGE98_04740 [Actinomycetota bacterium]